MTLKFWELTGMTLEQAKESAQKEANRSRWPQRIITQGLGFGFISTQTPNIGCYLHLLFGPPIYPEISDDKA